MYWPDIFTVCWKSVCTYVCKISGPYITPNMPNPRWPPFSVKICDALYKNIYEQLSKPGKLQPLGLNLVCRQQLRHCSQMYVSEVRVTCLRSWTYQQKWNSVHTFDKKYIIWLKTWHRLTVFWCKLLMYLFSWFHSDHLLNYNSKNCVNSIQIIHNNQKI